MNWGVKALLGLAERCPSNQTQYMRHFIELRKKYEARLDKLGKHPPDIDWEYYKRNVRKEYVKMVESFEKVYKGVKIPYPVDKYTQQIENFRHEVEGQYAEFIQKSNQSLEKLEEELEQVKSIIPFGQMTREEFAEIYPNLVPDFINHPTFWPHTPEEQLGYVEPKKEKKKTRGELEREKKV